MKLSCTRIFQVCAASALFVSALCVMNACTVSNDAVSYESTGNVKSHGNGENGSSEGDDTTDVDTTGTSSGNFDVGTAFEDYSKYLQFERVRAMSIARGNVKYSVSAFFIATTEVTQGLYKDVMGSLPDQTRDGDALPVSDVSWYDAVLFCNALSKKVGLDTVYVYDSVGEKNYLKNLTIEYSRAGVRLPTETEWELAARGGTETRFYWDVEDASDYAYYGQSKGPVEVGGFKPNDYGLYDMAGNVAEWVNDWYSAYSSSDQVNPTGPKTGTTKCVRGGGWADKVADIAPKEREKKDPLYHGAALGFRVVYSGGF